MASKRLSRYAALLRKLRRVSSKERGRILKKCCRDRDFVLCICEICHNILRGNVALTRSQKNDIRKRKKALRALVLKKTSLDKKRKIVQKGGFLGAILAPIASLLTGLLTR